MLQATKNEFSQYIKVIGRGKKAGKYLTQEQAYRAFKLILSGSAAPEQVGAFLMLLRVREESVQELAGFVKACREFTQPQLTQLQVDIDMGCYAGKRRHLPWFLLAVLALVQSGKTFFLHGCKEPDSQRLYLPEVFDQLNIPIAASVSEAKQQLNNFGFAYMDIGNMNAPVAQLLQMRTLFGLRSPANTLARMLNPCAANYSLHGVFHHHFDQRHIEVAKLLGDQGVACFRGEGGEIEVNPERAFDLYVQDKGSTIFSFPALLENWQIKPAQLKPAELEQLWLGKLSYPYGQQAILGTMACILLLIKQANNCAQALAQAQNIWQSRTRVPFKHLFAEE